MRLIDAERLKDDLAVLLERNSQLVDEWLAYAIEDTIDEQSTVEAEPIKHGKWLTTPTGWAYCSVCDREPPNETNERTDYCPNCGAKMDEVTEW